MCRCVCWYLRLYIHNNILAPSELCSTLSKRSFNHRNCMCAVGFSPPTCPKWAITEKKIHRRWCRCRCRYRYKYVYKLNAQQMTTYERGRERDRERGGRYWLWVGKAYSGRISPATDTHVLLMTTQSVAGMQSRPPWNTHPCIRIAPPGRLSVWQPLSTSTSLFIYPAWQRECSMRYMQWL